MKVIGPLAVSPTAIYTLNQIHGRTLARRDIAHSGGMHPATITRAVQELLAAGLVLETGERPSRGGRRSVLMEVNPAHGTAVGVDIGSHLTRVGLCDFAGKVIGDRTYQSADIKPEALPGLVTEALAAAGDPAILGIGVGISGTVHEDKGATIFCPNLPGWNNLPLRDMLAQKLQAPVYVDTSARALAQAEAWFGHGRGISDMVFISIGYSIGAGILTGGRVFRSAAGFAGELGHVASENDERCTCGNVGCLENVATLPVIARRIVNHLQANEVYSPLRNQLWSGNKSEMNTREAHRAMRAVLDNNPRLIQAAVAQGDKLVRDSLHEVAELLGAAIANMATVLSPQLIVLGGGVTVAIPFLVEEVTRVVRNRTLSPIQQQMAIRASALGETSPIIGGATLALEHYLQRNQYIVHI